jgi:hypothetical protein
MTMPHERTRTVVQTGEFLAELAQDQALPYRVRQNAKFLLRHYPSRFVVLLAGRLEEEGGSILEIAGPIFSSSLEAPPLKAVQSVINDVTAVITFKAPGRVMQKISVRITDGLGQATLDILEQAIDEARCLMSQGSIYKTPESSLALRERVALAQAQINLLNNGDWISDRELGTLAELPSETVHLQVEKWKSSGLIFYLRHLGTDYFPRYVLDAKNSYRPLTGVAPVITALIPIEDNWRLAFWFDTPCSALGGQRPKDRIQIAPQDVLKAAKAKRSDSVRD